MAGNWRDPLVGRDVLVGMLLGVGGHAILFIGSELLSRKFGLPADVYIGGMLTTRLSAGGVGETFFGWQFFMSLLHGMGYETGIDLDALLGHAAWLSEQLGKDLPGQVYKAGNFDLVAA